jgi:murein DD-endopeptidase MepM/ murein hydrolase activator NlpD
VPKGIGPAIRVILILVVFLLLLVIYVKMVADNTSLNTELNLLSASIMKAENTYYIMERSLGTTWYVSTVQTIYSAGDESIACGNVDDENKYSSGGTVTNDIREGYWYQGTLAKKMEGPTTLCKSVIPLGTKYNNDPCNPMICAPEATHLKKYLDDEIIPYQDITKEFTVNNVQVNIDNIKTVYEVTDDKITSDTTQSIKITDNIRTTIDNPIKNKIDIYTSFNKMVTAGRYITNILYLTSLKFQQNTETAYGTGTGERYLQDNKELIKNAIMKFASEPELKMNDVITNVAFKKFEVIKVTDDNMSSGITPSVKLVLHYDADVMMIEGGEVQETTSNGLYDWPTESKRLVSCYGPRLHPVYGDSRFHNGLDIGAKVAGENDQVMAAEDGEIVDVELNCEEGVRSCGSGYGNYIILKHEDGYYTFYAHLKKGDIYAQVGDDKKKGDVIARMGSTGISTGVHLHFEVRKDVRGERVDPCKFIDCTLSTEQKCTSFGVREGYEGYYYNDEDANTFDKRPISLVFGIEDYLTALDCNTGQPFKFFSWKNPGDLLCCMNKLWTCCVDQECSNIDIPYFEDGYKFYNGQKALKWNDEHGGCAFIQNADKIVCENGAFKFNIQYS